MTYVPLDPRNVVILFADLQPEIIKKSKTLAPVRLKVGVGGLAQLAHIFRIPVVVTATDSQITPEIAKALGDVETHVRTTADAFLDAKTRKAIESLQHKTLLISGFTTEVVVQLSALSAVANGYQAQVVVDACGGLMARTEDAALLRMVHAGVVPTSVVTLAGQLAGDFNTLAGRKAQKVLLEVANAPDR